jgi:hypothetical protein
VDAGASCPGDAAEGDCREGNLLSRFWNWPTGGGCLGAPRSISSPGIPEVGGACDEGETGLCISLSSPGPALGAVDGATLELDGGWNGLAQIGCSF